MTNDSIRLATEFLDSLPGGVNRSNLLKLAFEFRCKYASNPDICAFVDVGVASALYITGDSKVSGEDIKQEMQRLLQSSVHNSTQSYRHQCRAMASIGIYEHIETPKPPELIQHVMRSHPIPVEEPYKKDTQMWTLWGRIDAKTDRVMSKTPLVDTVADELDDVIPLASMSSWTDDDLMGAAHLLVPMQACDLVVLRSDVVNCSEESLRRVDDALQSSARMTGCAAIFDTVTKTKRFESDFGKVLVYTYAYYSIQSFLLHKNVCKLDSLEPSFRNTVLVFYYTIQRLCCSNIYMSQSQRAPERIDCIICVGIALELYSPDDDHLLSALKAAVGMKREADDEIVALAIEILASHEKTVPDWFWNSPLVAGRAAQYSVESLALYKNPNIRDNTTLSMDALGQIKESLSTNTELRSCISLLRGAYADEGVRNGFPKLTRLLDLVLWRLETKRLRIGNVEGTSALMDAVEWVIRVGHKRKPLGNAETANIRTAAICAFSRFIGDFLSEKALFTCKFRNGNPSNFVTMHKILYRKRQLLERKHLRSVEDGQPMRALAPCLEMHELVDTLPVDGFDEAWLRLMTENSYGDDEDGARADLTSALCDAVTRGVNAVNNTACQHIYLSYIDSVFQDEDVQSSMMDGKSRVSWRSLFRMWFDALDASFLAFERHLNHSSTEMDNRRREALRDIGVQNILKALALFARDRNAARIRLACGIARKVENRHLGNLGGLATFLQRLAGAFLVDSTPQYECVTKCVATAIRNVVKAASEEKRVESKRSKKKSKQAKKVLLKGRCPTPTSPTTQEEGEDGEDDAGLDEEDSKEGLLSLPRGQINLTSAWQEMARPNLKKLDYKAKLESDSKAATVLITAVRGFVARRKLLALKALARFKTPVSTSFASVTRAPPPPPPPPPPLKLEAVKASTPDIRSFRSMKLCRYGVHCRFGEQCKFYHPPPSPEAATPAQRMAVQEECVICLNELENKRCLSLCCKTARICVECGDAGKLTACPLCDAAPLQHIVITV